MENTYTLHRLTEADFERLIPLVKDAFGTNVNVEYYRWKYIRNPAGIVLGYYAMDQHGEVASYYGLIPERYYLDGKETQIYQACDGMTHSNHRRRGLFEKIIRKCYEDALEDGKIFVIGFPGAKSTPGLIKAGWRAVPDVRMRQYLYPSVLAHLRLSRSGQGVSEATREEVAGIAQSLPVEGPVRVCKRPDMFHWRTSNPRYAYRFLKYGQGAEQSYLIYYHHQQKAVVFDFHFATPTAKARLMNYLKNLVLREKLRGMVHFCQEGSTYSRALKRSGFLANPFSKGPASYVVQFIVLADDDTWSRYGRRGCWDLNSYDHDAL